jgi:hypothetical protein
VQLSSRKTLARVLLTIHQFRHRDESAERNGRERDPQQRLSQGGGGTSFRSSTKNAETPARVGAATVSRGKSTRSVVRNIPAVEPG